jgi:lipoprotein-anchoring transpeptidase ErfK/SrfK
MHAPPRAFRTVFLAGLIAVGALACPGTALAEAPSFLVADASHGATVHAWPGGPVTVRLSGRTPLGSPLTLWVVDRRDGGRWGRVVLPTRPNGRTGWIKLRTVDLRRTNVWVIGNLARRHVTLMRGNRPVASFRAAIGASSSPTPAGRFSVTDLVATGNPGGPYGWFAFGLSGHQPNLPASWSGGDQLAIHGTNAPSTIGRAASAGCLRVTASALARMRHAIRLGTPVLFVRNGKSAWRMARHASVTASGKPTVKRDKPSAEPAPIILVGLGPSDPDMLTLGPINVRRSAEQQPGDRARKLQPPLAIGVMPAIRAGVPPMRLAGRCMAGPKDGHRPPQRRARARAPT